MTALCASSLTRTQGIPKYRIGFWRGKECLSCVNELSLSAPAMSRCMLQWHGSTRRRTKRWSSLILGSGTD